MGTILSRFREGAAVFAHLLRRQVVHIGIALFDQMFGPLVKLVEIVRGEIGLIAPIEAEPPDIVLDGIDKFLLFLRGVCIVEPEIAAPAEFFGDSEIQANRLGVPNVQVAIGFRWETGDDCLVPAGGQIIANLIPNEIPCFFLNFAVAHSLRHRLPREALCARNYASRQEIPGCANTTAVRFSEPLAMTSTLITNIGAFFTGSLQSPTASVTSLLIDEERISALNPDDGVSADRTINANGLAVLPGLVDGHVHPVFGEWTPTQDAIGWIGNYLHGGTTSMVSAGELHTPGLDYGNLTPDLVTSLAEVTLATTGRERWRGVKLHAGTVLLVPGMTESHFDRLAAAGSILAKFIFYPLEADRDEAQNYTRWCRERGIRTKVHTGGVSRSGSSQVCGFETLSWLLPDIAAHVAGGPIPMSDEDLDRVVDETDFFLEVCSSGNYRSTLRAVKRLRERGRLDRLTIGTDTPGGTGVIPRGMLRNILLLSSVCELTPGETIALATGNTARAHGLDVGLLEMGAPADLLIAGPVTGSAGSTLDDAIAHGDLPGISFILIDGEVVVDTRSEQTPPPSILATIARF